MSEGTPTEREWLEGLVIVDDEPTYLCPARSPDDRHRCTRPEGHDGAHMEFTPSSSTVWGF